MTIKHGCAVVILIGLTAGGARAADGFIPRFSFESSDIALHRLAQPNTYFDKVGRKFAILGFESGSFEAWAYPLKILRNFEFSFLIGSSTQPILGKDIVRDVAVTPAATTLTYAFQSFTVKATYITAIEDPGAVILLAVDSTEPLTVVCSFLPVLQPMWPAGHRRPVRLLGRRAQGLSHLASRRGRTTALSVRPRPRGSPIRRLTCFRMSPNQFKIAVDKPDAARNGSFRSSWPGARESARTSGRSTRSWPANPEAVYRAAAEHYRRLRAETLRVKTPDAKLDLAFEWAKVAYDNLIVDNPDLGRGLVAGLGTSGTGGRPGFGWFFGGDAFMNSLSLDGYGAFGTVRDALLFTQKWQREDGKMAHELSQAAGYLELVQGLSLRLYPRRHDAVLHRRLL